MFITEYLDCCYYTAVIVDLDNHQFYHALFLSQQHGSLIKHFLYRKGMVVSCEEIRELAKKSFERRGKKFLNITEDNWKELLDA